jgi:hypothetical protein
LVNQARANNSLGPIGFINPIIYEVAPIPSLNALFHDIVIGTNGFYHATIGYDLATGWGSFIGTSLIPVLSE